MERTRKNGRQVEGTQTIVSGMAGRYATALFELALDDKAVDAVKADLDQFDALIADSADLRAAGAQPGVQRRGAGAGRSPPCSTRPASAGSPRISCSVVATQPPAVRGARHDPRLPRAGRPAQGRGDRRGHRRRDAQRRASRRAQGRAQVSHRRRTSISTSRSIRRSSAG